MKIPPPLCVWCNAPWTDDMLKLFCRADLELGYYDDVTLGFINVNLDITCSSCKRLVYRKEIVVEDAEANYV